MKNFSCKKFKTEAHSQGIDFIHNQSPKSIENNSTSIIYLTLDCPPYTNNSSKDISPLEYVNKMRLQYPENIIKILIPIINDEPQSKPLLKFKFFVQNRITYASIYKLSRNKFNIDVLGIYSPAFSKCNNITAMSRINYLAPFIKAARTAVKELKCDIVHCETIPYYLGMEFEEKINPQAKVFQIIKDFTQIELCKTETFWAAINLADKKNMAKICKDNIVRKNIANLFKIHNIGKFHKINDCLFFIYTNYYKFRKYIDKGADIDENIIFRNLNQRIVQLFPNLDCADNEIYFNPMSATIKYADWISTVSKTYYNEIFSKAELTGQMYKHLIERKDKTSYISFGFDKEECLKKNIYHDFNLENFREQRGGNKTLLLKEFSENRIKTDFVDKTLFKDEESKIAGYLDSFYQAPLLFANPDNNIIANGTDILFNTILKLFELQKNIQVIICIKDGLKSNFIKSWVEFLIKNKFLNGRWVFIDGNINPEKFLAASDMILIPRRNNMISNEHFRAMFYGCVPIAARSGILNDTISDIFDDITNGCGFKTKTSLLYENDTGELFLNSVMKALNLYQNNPSSWNLLIKNCMKQDTDWSFEILQGYQEVYKKLK